MKSIYCYCTHNERCDFCAGLRTDEVEHENHRHLFAQAGPDLVAACQSALEAAELGNWAGGGIAAQLRGSINKALGRLTREEILDAFEEPLAMAEALFGGGEGGDDGP